MGPSVYGSYTPFIVVVYPCRCEPLWAGCCDAGVGSGERVLGVS